MKKQELVLVLSAGVAALTFLFGMIIFGFELLYVLFLSIIAIFEVIMPYFIIKYLRTKRLLKMEQYFPTLLRDLAEAKRAGMTFSRAIKQAARTDYGPLTGKVKSMHRKLSWGIPLPEVFKRFREEVEDSTFMRRGMSIILESYYSGGAIASTMDAIADATTTLQEVDEDRKNLLRQQLLMIYVIHFVFIGTIVAMFKIMIPLLTVSPGGGGGGQGGEQQQEGQFGGIAGGLGGAPSMDYFRTLFLITLVVQSVGNGIVAGEARSGNVVAGIKHAAIMLAGSLVGYSLFILPKTTNLTVSITPAEPSPGQIIDAKVSYKVDRQAAENAEVVATFANKKKTVTADESGQATVSFTAPQSTGTYELKITATYEETEASSTKEVLVK